MSDFNYELVGQRLQEERESAGLSRVDMGALTSVSSRTINSYEKGERVFNADYVYRLEQKGFDIQYILFNRRYPSNITAEDLELLHSINSLEKKDLEAIRQIIHSMSK